MPAIALQTLHHKFAGCVKEGCCYNDVLEGADPDTVIQVMVGDHIGGGMLINIKMIDFITEFEINYTKEHESGPCGVEAWSWVRSQFHVVTDYSCSADAENARKYKENCARASAWAADFGLIRAIQWELAPWANGLFMMTASKEWSSEYEYGWPSDESDDGSVVFLGRVD